jgi:uncharacterized protein YbjT (DUF2867 family)
MSTRSLKVLVYGATGSQSKPVVHTLLAHGHQPFVVTRSAAKASDLAAAGATIVEADMADRARLVEISQGIDAVALLVPFFLPDPTSGLELGRNAIDAAREAGVRLLVWNTSGTIPPQATGNPSLDQRIALAEYLQTVDLPHIIIQPFVYAENLLGPWTAPFVANANQVAYPTPPAMRVAWIASEDVGELMVAALERPELAGSSFQVSGIEPLNGPELAAQFSAALGREISYHALPPQEFGAILDQVFGPGAGAAAAGTYEQLWQTDQYPPMHTDMAPVLEKLPVKMHTMREWVSKHAAVFTG